LQGKNRNPKLEIRNKFEIPMLQCLKQGKYKAEGIVGGRALTVFDGKDYTRFIMVFRFGHWNFCH
jgi:hypothetical protein